MTPAEAERSDEALLITGLTWREAASLTNEAAEGSYIIWSRADKAQRIAQARRRG